MSARANDCLACSVHNVPSAKKIQSSTGASCVFCRRLQIDVSCIHITHTRVYIYIYIIYTYINIGFIRVLFVRGRGAADYCLDAHACNCAVTTTIVLLSPGTPSNPSPSMPHRGPHSYCADAALLPVQRVDCGSRERSLVWLHSSFAVPF